MYRVGAHAASCDQVSPKKATRSDEHEVARTILRRLFFRHGHEDSAIWSEWRRRPGSSIIAGPTSQPKSLLPSRRVRWQLTLDEEQPSVIGQNSGELHCIGRRYSPDSMGGARNKLRLREDCVVPPSNAELFEMLRDLQADVGALTKLMYEANPELAGDYRRRADELREEFRIAWPGCETSNAELFEMLRDLQADVGALTKLMFEASPELAGEYRRRADQLREDFRLANRDRQDQDF